MTASGLCLARAAVMRIYGVGFSVSLLVAPLAFPCGFKVCLSPATVTFLYSLRVVLAITLVSLLYGFRVGSIPAAAAFSVLFRVGLMPLAGAFICALYAASALIPLASATLLAGESISLSHGFKYNKRMLLVK